MKPSRFTEERTIGVLREQEVAEVCDEVQGCFIARSGAVEQYANIVGYAETPEARAGLPYPELRAYGVIE